MEYLKRKIKAAGFSDRDKQAIGEFLEICDSECREIGYEINHPCNGQFDAQPSNAVVSVTRIMRDVLK